MSKRRASYDDVDPAEITPEHVYRNRRAIIRLGLSAGLAAGVMGTAACAADLGSGGPYGDAPGVSPGQTSASKDELDDQLNTFEQITNYNNYYEFSVEKEAVARLAKDFKTEPWSVQVGGLVHKPRTYSMEELLERFPQEERVYRLRCVEGWSMVIPWLGFPLRLLLDDVEPASRAKYVRFETVRRPSEMPGQSRPGYSWPYVEALRLDEAMHDLSLLVTGLYGKTVPAQNGAPLRLAVPWKYGFKSAKALVRIDLVEGEPQTFWMKAAPTEYGFYANVNPEVPHPRWSQSSERRIGELRRRPTLLFNGYRDVARLYEGMDLRRNF